MHRRCASKPIFSGRGLKRLSMNMKKIYLYCGTALAAASLLTACGKKGHGLEGSVSGAKEGSWIVLEQLNNFGDWFPIDSAQISSDGSFFLPYIAPAEPELYRVKYGRAYVYLPVDSTEQLSLKANAAAFATDFTLSGSDQARDLTAFEKEANRIESLANPDSTDAFRRRVFTNYLQNSKGNILSYYILQRPFAGGYLIEYTDPLYWAVAQQYVTYRPNDKRTKALEERTRQGQSEARRAKGRARTAEVREVGMFDISLPDKDGKTRTLSDITGKGKRVILVFTSMRLQATPAINLALRGAYDAGQADIYEVCLDNDLLTFKNGAQGLPWAVVRDEATSSSRNLTNYNVNTLPRFIIFDSNGDINQAASSVDEALKLLKTVP